MVLGYSQFIPRAFHCTAAAAAVSLLLLYPTIVVALFSLPLVLSLKAVSPVRAKDFAR